MLTLYQERISALHESLQAEATRAGAAELMRSLVEQITLVPEIGVLRHPRGRGVGNAKRPFR